MPDEPEEVQASLAAVQAELEGVSERPLSEHVEVFDRVHRSLQDVLATLDEA